MKPKSIAAQLAIMLDDPLVKLSDALPLLGNVHRSTAIRWHQQGKLNLVKIGAAYRIRASELLRISEGRIQQCLGRVESAATSSSAI